MGAVGVFAEELRLEPAPNFVGTGFVSPGDEVWLLGQTHADDIGGSEVQSLWLGKIDGPPPQLDLALEKAVQDVVRSGIESGWIRSAHDCSEGGLGVAVAECLIKGAHGLGLHMDLPAGDVGRVLFSESASRVVVSVAPADASHLQQAGVPAHRLGTLTQTGELEFATLSVAVGQLRAAHDGALTSLEG
ncbi:MAG: AIR synthase-related protein [bacterium]